MREETKFDLKYPSPMQKTSEEKISVKIQGMTCSGCVATVEKTIKAIDGIKNVSVSLIDGQAEIILGKKGKNIAKEISEKIREKGYKVETKKAIFLGDVSWIIPQKIKESLEKINGIVSVKLNQASEEIEIEFVPGFIEIDDIKNELKKQGIKIKGVISEEKQEILHDETKTLKTKFIFSIPPSTYFIFKMLFGFHTPHIVDFLVSTPVILFLSSYFSKGFLRKLISFSFDMNFLVSIGIYLGYFVSTLYVFFPNLFREEVMFFESSVLITSIMLLGKSIELSARKDILPALKKLSELEPKKVKVKRNGEEIDVKFEDVKVGDKIILFEGERVSHDGILIKGIVKVDESHITGELEPKTKLEGEKIFSGSLILEGSGILKVESEGENTILRKIISSLRQAQFSKSSIEKFGDKISQFFVPFIISISFFVFIYWILADSFVFALERALSTIVVACPCALGLATPTAVASAIGKALSKKILIRDGSIFEILPKIKVVVFDKTGTITEGKLKLKDIILFNPEYERKETLFLISSCEMNSNHPIAKAIINFALSEGIKPKNPDFFFNSKGKGVFAKIYGNEIAVGKPEFLEETGVKIEDKEKERIEKLFKENKNTSVLFGINGKLVGALIFEDNIKEKSKEVVNELKKIGLKVFILTGDKFSVAEKVSSILGVDGFFADVLPDKKTEIIKSLRKYGKVMMVGDGINDAPALAEADVGVAISSASEISKVTADVVVEDIDRIIHIFKLGKKTFSIIKQNFLWAFFYNLILIPIAAGMLYKRGISLKPFMSAIAMSLSSIFVVLNSLRIRNLSL
jgi:Cu+-exporting ATPase